MKQSETLGFAGRYRTLVSLIDASFDLPRIARLALGREWDTLDARQQQAYVATFRKDTTATYAQRFEVTGTRGLDGGRRRIDTVIIAKNGGRTTSATCSRKGRASGAW